jgi:hypothetical protein
MVIDNALIESTVLRLFERFKVRHAGGRLSPEDLRAAWPTVRLRASDLELGLRELVYGGALRWIETEDGPLLELTELGAEQLKVPGGFSESALRGWWTDFSFRVSRTQTGGPPPALDRRRQDRVARRA